MTDEINTKHSRFLNILQGPLYIFNTGSTGPNQHDEDLLLDCAESWELN